MQGSAYFASLLKTAFNKNKSNDKTIIELDVHKISWLVSLTQINYLPQYFRQIIYLLVTNKSQYFAQPRPIIVD